MSISLVTITHPIDPQSEVPFIGGRAPLSRIAVETWKVHHIVAMGFTVEVHEEPYDPLAVANAQAVELAQALASGEEPEATVEEVTETTETVVQETETTEEVTETTETVVQETETTEEVTETGDEDITMTEEDIAALRARIEGLTTKVDAEALIAEYGIQMEPVPAKLKDIKSQLLAMLDGE